ncbi:aminotransferase class V-fold PLP-dependent enzyme [Rhizohabitans arisaemae]|uniref:aminotransferase class V-fold PLP-dependent enzyme n=1 Tax=Rhizohabitans arisaemae TaxID=2720610 RepID=UPI0024B17C99|nr:aminotransferase class V-fold PLP-dependent enzyme [Rhizohabitans arisaemae]
MTANPTRRALLGGGVLAGVAGLAGCTATGSEPAQPPRKDTAAPFDPADWDSVRAQFALDPALAHFAAFTLAAHPAPVRAAVERHRQGLDADTDLYLHGATGGENAQGREEAVRQAAARHLGTDPGRIALTDSTTMGLGLLYTGLKLRPGQRILTTEHDFYATHESIALAASRHGVAVDRARLYDDPASATVDEIVSRLRARLTPRTRVVAITWVHSGTGVRLPVKAVADMLAEFNRDLEPRNRALLCVDGIHGLGAVDAGVDDLGADFLVSGTHKWLFGPRGTGLVWGRAWDAVTPVIPSFSGPDNPHTPGGYHSFEHRWAVTEAFAFHEAIGRARVAERTRELATRLKEGLAGIGGLRLITPRDPALSAGLVCCAVASDHPAAVVRRLRDEHGVVAGITPYRDVYLRFGPSIVTSPAQVDLAIKATAALV